MKGTTTIKEDPMDIQEPTLWDKVGVAAVSLLLAAFLMGVASPVVAGASTSDNAKRDDDFRAITAVEDDEDDDDRDVLRDKSKKSGKKGKKDKSGKGKKSGKGSGKSRVALADSKGTRDQTGKSTRKDKSDRTGKNTGNGSDTRTGNSRDGTATGAQSKPSKSAPSASRG